MSIIGTSFIPDNACPCEEATVQYLEVQPGQWEAVIVSCPKNCELPEILEGRCDFNVRIKYGHEAQS